MDCGDILSEDVYDFIVEYGYFPVSGEEPICIQPLTQVWQVAYYDAKTLPPLSVEEYTYTAIPNCYALESREMMEEAGILPIQNLDGFELRGNGVLVGIIATGISYEEPMFRNADGSTRIAAIWDQSIAGVPPEGFLYGTEYTKEQIDEALQSEEPYAVVPHRDSEGEGTYMASLAAGGESEDGVFIGAAPEAVIAVVKLKPAKQYLRDFYFIRDDAHCYQENDIMAAIWYLNELAGKLRMPLSVCCPLGSNNGSHAGETPLSGIVNVSALRRGCAVSISAGNEANKRHHYKGALDAEEEYEDVEINVGENVTGFVLELWGDVPRLFSVAVISPSGEFVPRTTPRQGVGGTYRFVFEQTEVSIAYRITGGRSGNELVFLRFDKPAKGLWNIRVYNGGSNGGEYHMWLPISEFLSGEVIFLQSDPQNTVTTPGMAVAPMTVGAYDAVTGGIYQDSGRGYSLSGVVKPDFTQPGVRVEGRGRDGIIESRTGTSGATAINSGAAALMLEWGIVRGNDLLMNGTTVKNAFIRGCEQADSRLVPNPVWGYGKANLYNTFDKMRFF